MKIYTIEEIKNNHIAIYLTCEKERNKLLKFNCMGYDLRRYPYYTCPKTDSWGDKPTDYTSSGGVVIQFNQIDFQDNPLNNSIIW